MGVGWAMGSGPASSTPKWGKGFHSEQAAWGRGHGCWLTDPAPDGVEGQFGLGLGVGRDFRRLACGSHPTGVKGVIRGGASQGKDCGPIRVVGAHYGCDRLGEGLQEVGWPAPPPVGSVGERDCAPIVGVQADGGGAGCGGRKGTLGWPSCS